ncbi:hypothetical protein C0Q44_15045 [Paenibacillus sp. PCH8]|uniref:hypothetical protein n=1 Tax=Paenibacillus sp. PCH8 TaxID=2066524 RepID=UPI000CFA4E1F|nr:hypothetical protein [Paenibacillus sp. PCH8]PQP82716.1 hypothetical protein C0Q44_15045 [Paenibacillus sp. PCH8]
MIMKQNEQTHTSDSKKTKSWIRRHPILTTFTLLFLMLVVALFLYFMLRPYFSTFDRSEQGDLSYSMPSRNGEYTVEIYGVPYGGAGRRSHAMGRCEED